MKITSPAFQNNGHIPAQYTCDGEDINMALKFEGIPPGTKSLALVVDDPDAPFPGGWVHWTIFNMNPETQGIAEDSAPASGTQAMTNFPKPGYGGPCPPSGTHRYQFKLYALDAMLDLGEFATREDIEKAMEGHILDQALLVGLYERQ